jgi:hypothetical protein
LWDLGGLRGPVGSFSGAAAYAGTGGGTVAALGGVEGSAVKICALPLTQTETRSVWAISALV